VVFSAPANYQKMQAIYKWYVDELQILLTVTATALPLSLSLYMQG
jgi:hypothetical protein